jgi:hypothetical protein
MNFNLATISNLHPQSHSDTLRPSNHSAPARLSSLSSQETHRLCASPSWNITPCFPRPMYTTSLATTYVHIHLLCQLDEASLLLPKDQTLGFVRVCPAIKSSMTLEGILLLTFLASQIELGTACGKLFRCSTMAVLDAGDSDILSGQTA